MTDLIEFHDIVMLVVISLSCIHQFELVNKLIIIEQKIVKLQNIS